MTQNEIIKLCNEKEQELLDKYFGNLVHEAAIEMPETIGEYTKDLPLRLRRNIVSSLKGYGSYMRHRGCKVHRLC